MLASAPRIGYVLVVALALAACGSNDETTVAGAEDDPALVPTWTDSAGQELHDGLSEPYDRLVINTQPGPAHCEWEQAMIMLVAFPVGTDARGGEAIRQYVRDPQGVLPAPSVKTDFDPDVALPEDAEPSGLHNGDWELWTAPSTADRFVYLSNGDRFEAWPRADPRIGCD